MTINKPSLLENASKKSFFSSKDIVIEIPSEVWGKVQTWYFESLSMSSQIELLSNYLLHLAVNLENKEENE